MTGGGVRREEYKVHLALTGNLGFSGDMHMIRCKLSLTQSMKYCFMLSDVSSSPGLACHTDINGRGARERDRETKRIHEYPLVWATQFPLGQALPNLLVPWHKRLPARLIGND